MQGASSAASVAVPIQSRTRGPNRDIVSSQQHSHIATAAARPSIDHDTVLATASIIANRQRTCITENARCHQKQQPRSGAPRHFDLHSGCSSEVGVFTVDRVCTDEVLWGGHERDRGLAMN